MSREFAARVEGIDPLAPLLTALEQLPSGMGALDRTLALDRDFFLADHNLIYTDKMAMSVGVEVRVPFLDPDLVSLSARIPAAVKLRGREAKWVLKRAMEPHLPHDVIYRPKTGFGAPVRRWLHDGLRPLVDEHLGAERIRSRGIFDPLAVRALIEADRTGRVDAAYPILSILCIELWASRFLDQRN